VRRARRAYRQQSEIKKARRERARLAYREKRQRLPVDHTSSMPQRVNKVLAARSEGDPPPYTQRAPPHHVEELSLDLLHRLTAPREDARGLPKCSNCGRPGDRVLHGTLRFHR
jgi:hypothetical protein